MKKMFSLLSFIFCFVLSAIAQAPWGAVAEASRRSQRLDLIANYVVGTILGFMALLSLISVVSSISDAINSKSKKNNYLVV